MASSVPVGGAMTTPSAHEAIVAEIARTRVYGGYNEETLRLLANQAEPEVRRTIDHILRHPRLVEVLVERGVLKESGSQPVHAYDCPMPNYNTPASPCTHGRVPVYRVASEEAADVHAST